MTQPWHVIWSDRLANQISRWKLCFCKFFPLLFLYYKELNFSAYLLDGCKTKVAKDSFLHIVEHMNERLRARNKIPWFKDYHFDWLCVCVCRWWMAGWLLSFIIRLNFKVGWNSFHRPSSSSDFRSRTGHWWSSVKNAHAQSSFGNVLKKECKCGATDVTRRVEKRINRMEKTMSTFFDQFWKRDWLRNRSKMKNGAGKRNERPM